MHVRNATPADTPALLAMGAKFYATTSYSEFAEYDWVTVSALIDLMRDGVLLVAEDDSGPVGVVGLVVAPFMFNGSRSVAYEVIWWVDPDAQGAGAGKALLAAIEPACRDRGVSAIQMVHLSNSPPQAAALYERMGYRHTESSYTKRVT
ncbi:GNAT family N-acetyltransferase [Lysobacter antibioticus]|uniref:Acetyltransferase family protein n=1 Tax=Lysobacter antibioticus TaxID=84531 RepID=A0A0S2F7K5_LYSAN|nr:GNAT family N-acetyltransferase [Lysobacter antibioticus]ALN79508.1 acetyltransferase family protein [Lysobacter antibioticus]